MNRTKERKEGKWTERKQNILKERKKENEQKEERKEIKKMKEKKKVFTKTAIERKWIERKKN